MLHYNTENQVKIAKGGGGGGGGGTWYVGALWCGTMSILGFQKKLVYPQLKVMQIILGWNLTFF